MNILIGSILFILGQTCLGSSVKHGTIGMGITMYKPVCAYACHDSLSSLYLNCTTFDAGTSDGMGMDMKLRKRMDMGSSATGTTSSACRAQNKIWLQTLAYCIQQNCAADNVAITRIEASWQAVAADGNPVPEFRSMIPTSAPKTEITDNAKWLNETSVFNRETYFANRQTLAEFEYQEDMHVKLSVIVMACTVVFFLIGGVYRALSVSKLGVPFQIWISKYLTLPALISSRHQVSLPYKIGYAPSRSLSIFITLYVAMNIVFSCVPYKSVLPHTYNAWYPNKKQEISTYVANRTGVLSFANMALAILFAGRNNPVTWATGVSQTTCLTFHRWSARVSALQSIVHSIIYTYIYFWTGGAAAYYEEAAKAYYWWGIIATIALFLGTALSVLPLRLHFYETFLVAHIALAIVALIGCWYHIYLRFSADWGYEVWLYIAFGFWLFDRFVRFARVVSYNWVGASTEAIAELLPGDEIIRLTVFPGRLWSFRPGQHTFLYFPGIGRMWESHPFSIAGWDVPTAIAASVKPITPTTRKSGLKEKNTHSDITVKAFDETKSSSPLACSVASSRPSITFLIRPSKGVTKALQRYLLARPHTPQSIDVLTEGPYGHSGNLKHFDHILCIGGGIGVTALLPYVHAFAISPAGSSLYEKKIEKKQNMVLAWTARETKLVEAVREMLAYDSVNAEGEGKNLEVLIGVTDGEEGRMQVGGIVKEVFEKATSAKVSGGGRLAVVVCGPPDMADEVRREVVARVGERGITVELFEESFCW